jgi:outer membrane lipoprotein-sorting protein
MKSLSVLFLALVVLQGCGEKSAFEQKAEQDAKARAEENKAAHEKRNQ